MILAALGASSRCRNTMEVFTYIQDSLRDRASLYIAAQTGANAGQADSLGRRRQAILQRCWV